VSPSEARSDQRRRGSSVTRAGEDLVVIARSQIRVRQQSALPPPDPVPLRRARSSRANPLSPSRTGGQAAPQRRAGRYGEAASALAGLRCGAARAAGAGGATRAQRPARPGGLRLRHDLRGLRCAARPAPVFATRGAEAVERRTRAPQPPRRLKPSPDGASPAGAPIPGARPAGAPGSGPTPHVRRRATPRARRPAAPARRSHGRRRWGAGASRTPEAGERGGADRAALRTGGGGGGRGLSGRDGLQEGSLPSCSDRLPRRGTSARSAPGRSERTAGAEAVGSAPCRR